MYLVPSALLLALSLSSITSPALAPVSPHAAPSWVVLVYMNGDNNLEEDALADFAEMASVGSSEDVKILVEFDRSPNYVGGYGNWADTKRFEVTRGMQPTAANALSSLGEVNMGSPEALSDFVRWGRARYPQSKVALIIWDHGQGYRKRLERLADSVKSRAAEAQPSPELQAAGTGGYRSVSHDETNHDKLYNAEVASGLETGLAGGRLEVLGFDACLMSMVETAYALRSFADAMVGSEELEPGEGWRYDDWLAALCARASMTAEELGAALVDSYARTTGASPSTTLSAIRLSAIDQAARSISAAADGLRHAMQTDLRSVAEARAACREYAPEDGRFHHVDAIRFFDELGTRTGDASLKELAGSASQSIKASVIKAFAGTGRRDSFGSNGLAIYFPASGRDYREDGLEEGGYQKNNTVFPVAFVRDHRWADFLHEWFAAVPVPRADQGRPADTTQIEKWIRPLTLRGQLLRAIDDPLLRSTVSSPRPQLTLVVQNDGKTAAKARIGLVAGDAMADVTLTGPISGGTLFDRSGLSTEVSAKFRAQYVRWQFDETDPATSPRARTTSRTEESAVKTLAQRIADDVAASQSTSLRYSRSETTTPDAESPRKLLRAVERAMDAPLRSGAATTKGIPLFVTGSYELGSREYKAVDADTLADLSVTRSSHTVEGALGVLLPRGVRTAENPGIYVGGTFEGFRQFKPTPERQICRPIQAGAFECDKFRVGPPKKKTGVGASVESRLWSLGGNLGLNPTAGYDFESGTWTVELPAYFLRLVADIDKPILSGRPDLAGGVTAGWKSTDKTGTRGGAYVLFFVGPSFKLPDPK
jgi:hypothetical protein